ncbi:hypothetical protein [Solimicrobium silvestre]|uniref:Uncharacterized protein n=1 Tax=Solimicrobium silvestre TaxID=2099400 RepID=A0A2S9GYE5_9BURK|nr:hypothetical protein [Solimicrobium silvestre]PRC92745.1 hypothetical protein S2091_2475 [Solimicrobium silvestre]
MITKETTPVQWAMFMYELEDAKEHLSNLISDINNDPEYDESALRVDLGHIYSHLNRAWYQHKTELDTANQVEFEKASQFPCDLKPT